jgi:hypothetical protein
MPKLETWLAFGSLGMGSMFIALMLSFLNFLIGPNGNGPEVYVDPTGVVIQLISIAGAPSIILAGIVFGLRKSYSIVYAAITLIITGIILIVGMIIAAWILIPKIEEQFSVGSFDVIPYIFTVAGIAIAILGSYLLRKSKNYKKLKDEIH